MTTERITFRGAFGDRLAARLERPDGPPRAFALFAHCFTCSKDLKAAVRISRSLAGRGIAVLRFDFTGLGESAGDFAETDFSSNLDDLVAAAELLAERWEAPRLLVGHSLGGAAVLAAAPRISGVRAVATIGAPCDTAHLRQALLAQAPELETADRAEVTLGGRTFTIRHELLQDLEEQPMRRAIAELGRPLLIFHSPVDEIVGIENARRIFDAARHPKSFVALDGADHLLLAHSGDAAFVADVLAAWAARYLGTETTGETEAAVELPQGEVEVIGGADGFAQTVAAGRHRFAADEPAAAGGTDTGPNPYDLLLAALGTCTSMTLRMYADRKGWPLDGIRVRLVHARVHAEDCRDCAEERARIERIERRIEVAGELSADQRARLLEIADRCPVHRTLTSDLDIHSELVAREDGKD